tara:strand:- start:58 stop:480 length:423 start_codon:yes stop_codon:yes gene_type:complete
MSEDILAGLKSAMSRGDSLQEAMQSFYNAGYMKRDIDAAARKLQTQLHSEPIKKAHEQKPINAKKSLPVLTPGKDEGANSKPQKTVQKVSDYDSKGKAKENPTMKKIMLLVILISLLAIILGSIFLFRENVLGLIDRFLS